MMMGRIGIRDWEEHWKWEVEEDCDKISEIEDPWEEEDYWEYERTHNLKEKIDTGEEEILPGKISFIGSIHGWNASYRVRKEGREKMVFERLSPYFEIGESDDGDGYIVRAYVKEWENYAKNGRRMCKIRVGEKILRVKELDVEEITNALKRISRAYRKSSFVLLRILVEKLIRTAKRIPDPDESV